MNKKYKILGIASFIIGAIIASIVVITKTKAVKEDINPFQHIIREEIHIDTIKREDNIFSWSLDESIDETKIKGYNYTVKVDDVPIIAHHTTTKQIEFKPTYKGEYTIAVTPVDIEQYVGKTKEYSFTIDDDTFPKIVLKDNKTSSILVEDSKFNNLFKKLVRVTNNVSINDMYLMYNELINVPEYVLKDMIQKGFKIYITGYDLRTIHTKESDMQISGLFQPIEKRIYISNWSSYIKKSTIHEIGHYIDYMLGRENYLSGTDDEFIEIFKAEKDLVEEPHHKTKVREYFAYGYSEFIKNPEELKERQPKTYEYMKNMEKKSKKLL